MAIEALYSLAPGFALDKDEDWMIYLPPEKQMFMRNQRQKLLLINENLDTFEAAFEKYLRDNKFANPTVLQHARKDHNAQRQKFIQKRNQTAERMLIKIRELKKEAIKSRENDQRVESEAATKRRRMNQVDPDIVDVDIDVELVPDDYLPSIPEDTKAKIKYVPKINEGATASQASRPRTPSAPTVDPLIKGVSPGDAKILIELKSMIMKYECRDRVLKAIQSYRSKDKTLRALAAFTTSMALLKGGRQNKSGS